MRKYAAAAARVMTVCAAAALILQPFPTAAEDQPAYVGTQVCAGCHKALYEQWLLTPHRRTPQKPSQSGVQRTPDIHNGRTPDIGGA